MSAQIHILPVVRIERCGAERVMMPCRRCGGLRKVTYDHLDDAQKARAPFGAVHPCPDCGEDAEVIEIETARRATRPLVMVQRPEGKR